MASAADLRRARALAIAVLAVVAIYFITLHWWWTAPMLAMGEEIAALRTEELGLRMEAAQRDRLRSELARVREFESGNPGFLSEANKELASAALVQRLEQVIGAASPNPNRCKITARTPTEASAKEPFTRVVVQVRLNCDMAELGAVLHALESGSPQLFIDNLDLLSRRSYLAGGDDGNGSLDVSFDLYGYLQATAAGVPGA